MRAHPQKALFLVRFFCATVTRLIAPRAEITFWPSRRSRRLGARLPYSEIKMLALGLSSLSFSAPHMGVSAAAPRAPVVDMKMPQWVQPAMAAALSAAVVMTPFSAEAARSGGRAGGRAPSSSMRSSMRSAPRAAPARTTNVYVQPAMPMGGMGMGYGGYGYGGGMMGGGGNGLGLYLGLSVAETFMREQQRQAYLQQQLRTQQELGRDQAAIQQLQMELQAQNAKVEQLKVQNGGQVPTTSVQQQPAPGEMEAMRQMLIQQQKELMELKAAK